jgi:short-subunit dehydrogenase
MTGTPTSDPDRSGGGGTVDRSHLLLVGAGPGLGMAVARRFAVGGYRVTLVARSTDKLDALAGSLSDTGAEIGTIEADASDPEGMKAAGFGTMIVTGGAFADHPIPALATVSPGKAALRSAATMLGADLEPVGIRVATLTIGGRIVAGTAFDPERIAERYWGRWPN